MTANRPLHFDAAVSVTSGPGGIEIARWLDGRRRRCILTTAEAMLCSLLERGHDPVVALDAKGDLAETVAARATRLRQQLRAFLDGAVGSNHTFAFDAPDNYASTISEVARPDLLSRDVAPTDLVWYVTHRCPRLCRYCHWVEKGRSDIEPDALATDDALALVYEAWIGGVERLVLTGGEPMLRRDLPKVISEARDLGLSCWLFTRYRITPARARQLREAEPSEIYYSLDSLSPAVNQCMVRNRSVAVEARDSLSNLVAEGLSVTVVPVITRENANEIPELAAELGELGIRRIRPICYKGKTGSNIENALFALDNPTREIVRCALDKAAAFLHVDESTLDLAPKIGLCESGLSTLYVQPNGIISYCPLTRGIAGQPLARLPNDSLTDVWYGARLAGMLSSNALAPLGARHIIRTTSNSSCALASERLDLISP